MMLNSVLIQRPHRGQRPTQFAPQRKRFAPNIPMRQPTQKAHEHVSYRPQIRGRGETSRL